MEFKEFAQYKVRYLYVVVERPPRLSARADTGELTTSEKIEN